MPDEATQPAPFDCSPSIVALATALSLAQGEFGDIDKSKSAKIDTFSFDYADLAHILKILRPTLSKHGLAVMHLPSRDPKGAVVVTTVLMHKSGEWVSTTLDWPVGKADARGVGSAITYARRYGTVSVCGVAATDDDDDGAGASEKQKAGDRQQQRPAGRAPAPAKRAEAAQTSAVRLADHPETISTTDPDGGKGQLGRLRSLIDEHKADRTVLGGYLKETFGYTKLSDIEQKQLAAIEALIQQGTFSKALAGATT